MGEPIVLALAQIIAMTALLAGERAPATSPVIPRMVKVVFRYESSKIKPDSYAAIPRTLYRWGVECGRLEEPPDVPRNLHALVIVQGRDCWMINLAARAGRHIIDPGPTFNFHASVFARAGAPESLRALEFGREMDYIRERDLKPLGIVGIGDVKCEHYRVDAEGTDVTIYMRIDRNVPYMLRIRSPGDDYAIRYDQWEELDAIPELFQPPSGITIEEPKRPVER
ncbi:MAG: hypothetical protein ACREJC_15415 [Tepidisphaeraceae bacterium]